MAEIVFLKLGGSLITDKTVPETPRPEILDRISREIKQALDKQPGMSLLLGHGSGSFGHVAAAKHGTREGVQTKAEWRGFAEVSSAAARLNTLVRKSLWDAGIPAVTFQPSASAICEDGLLISMSTVQIRQALSGGLVPLVYGDVAVDRVRGGTIISTEEIMTFLAPELEVSKLYFAGDTAGVMDKSGQAISSISASDLGDLRLSLGGSRGTDVTGGMAGKVEGMINLAKLHPDLEIRIFSGLEKGAVEQILSSNASLGTLVRGI